MHDHIFRRRSEWFLTAAPIPQPNGINTRGYLLLPGPAEVTQGSGSDTDRKKQNQTPAFERNTEFNSHWFPRGLTQILLICSNTRHQTWKWDCLPLSLLNSFRILPRPFQYWKVTYLHLLTDGRGVTIASLTCWQLEICSPGNSPGEFLTKKVAGAAPSHIR